MVTLREVVYRLKRVPPRRMPVVFGRYAVRTARARARRWHLHRNRGELPDSTLRASLGALSPEDAFRRFVDRFFVGPAEARETACWLAEHYPEHADRTRARADDALRHVVDLLGSGSVQLGPAIDWHRDFKTGIAWPREVLADDLDGLRLGEPCDIKVPWELSRCHDWVTLGRAYALRADSRYATEFVAQLDSWLAANPWPYGVNWSRAMEAAIRAINWLWAAALFAEAPEFTLAHRQRLLKALLQHGRHIIDNLEFADNNGNHYLSNGVGLLFLGVLLADFDEAAAWRHKGRQIVWGEMERQVYPDGVDFEQGIGYQGLVVEFWYSCVLLCERNGIDVPTNVRTRLLRMFEYMLAVTRPDGTFPQIGDNDDGRLAGTDDEPVGSFRRHLAVGAVMFDRPDLWVGAGDAVESAAWLCGVDRTQAARSAGSRASQPVEPSSRAFAAGGFYVMRTRRALMVIDAGDVGMRGIGGHGHADVLSFDLWAAGAPVLVDSGTFVYSADPAARNALRSTASHNALRIDGQDSSRLGGGRWLWLIENDAHPRSVRWSSSPDRDAFEGTHDGYRRLPEPVDHTRRIVFDKLRHVWTIEDTVTGRGEHLIELFFHPATPFELHPVPSSAAVPGDGPCPVRLHAPVGELWLFPPVGMGSRVEPGWISRGYGHREPAQVLVYSLRGPAPLRLVTQLVLVEPGTAAEAARCLIEPA
jgi:uncharacterized heparinase superfamily protein